MLIRLRFYVPEIVLGILLAVAIFGMGMLFGSSGHQPSNAPAQQQAAQQATKHQPDGSLWSWLTHDATGFFTLLLFVAVGVQAALFVWQLVLIARGTEDTKAAAEAAKQSADAFASAERPHLLVEELHAILKLQGVSADTANTLPVYYNFVVRNFGRSPGFIVRYVFQFHHGDLPPEPQYEALRLDKNIVVPNHKFQSGGDTKLADVPVEFIDKIRDNERPAYIFGMIEYRSIFDGRDHHRMRFCYRTLFRDRDLTSVMFYPDGPDSYWDYT